ncbi:undecaprenyldiphospho-muramoylpentapeptide beta-N-acetylglucosaminyltransferase [Alkalicella caledoniensis]|uniref:UDP-N-acetylglucosamine--N-acetylmuramyl-(pentapeptide) pyrophosphoryl-undecaprenol N-acetylglucosamine transferase n=1 Tax=Alkalicella caledoniensis TaxID=2731377 RepID=A0A7G9WA78_ALKCA|nr:undecaprenyldiphospho-muramoylpentapeptide beta-N-acetylglucosaminyltransferase [Alkalicella caledoniensis]QNO15590.1 undecaprenyldiphospho-muramoylpentapeptide beta-N-acetylglucosaminyltransferase [Alkalicella caledoniensis]
MKKIVLTGGGSAGHVTPNIALIPRLKELGYEIHYIGSVKGIERKLIEDIGIKYYPISSGKLRRYFDKQNFTDPFRIMKGVAQAYRILGKIKPDVIFSKGGFVTVPVILGGKIRGVPTVIHESDFTPGLANKLVIPVAKKVCVTFPETVKHIPKDKGVYTGTPIRPEVHQGKKEMGYALAGFNPSKPTIMVVGGSLGSKKLNDSVREILPDLLKEFQIVHLCGQGNLSEEHKGLSGYVQYEYVKEDLPHFFAMADLVISRAGANSIYELLALKKPNILVPLSAKASRGDQILNANSFEKMGYSKVLQEEAITNDILLNVINDVYKNKDKYIQAMTKSTSTDGTARVLEIIKQYSK